MRLSFFGKFPISKQGHNDFVDQLKALFPLISPSLLDDIKVAIGELFTNCRKHGHDDELEVMYCFTGKFLVFAILAQSHSGCREGIAQAIERGRSLVGHEWSFQDCSETGGYGFMLICGVTRTCRLTKDGRLVLSFPAAGLIAAQAA